MNQKDYEMLFRLGAGSIIQNENQEIFHLSMEDLEERVRKVRFAPLTLSLVSAFVRSEGSPVSAERKIRAIEWLDLYEKFKKSVVLPAQIEDDIYK